MKPLALEKKFKLTKREGEVAVLLARGCARKDIASQLDISISSVRDLIFKIRHKLQASSMISAAVILARLRRPV